MTSTLSPAWLTATVSTASSALVHAFSMRFRAAMSQSQTLPSASAETRRSPPGRTASASTGSGWVSAKSTGSPPSGQSRTAPPRVATRSALPSGSQRTDSTTLSSIRRSSTTSPSGQSRTARKPSASTDATHGRSGLQRSERTSASRSEGIAPAKALAGRSKTNTPPFPAARGEPTAVRRQVEVGERHAIGRLEREGDGIEAVRRPSTSPSRRPRRRRWRRPPRSRRCRGSCWRDRQAGRTAPGVSPSTR